MPSSCATLDPHEINLRRATEIYEDPQTRFVADFIGDTNLIDGEYRRNGDGDCVQWGSVDVPIDRRDGFGDGDAVTASIRPEKIHIDDGDPLLSGAVEDVIYQGNTMKIHVDVDGQRMVVEEHVERVDALPTVGDEVSMTWDDDQTKLFMRGEDE